MTIEHLFADALLLTIAVLAWLGQLESWLIERRKR